MKAVVLFLIFAACQLCFAGGETNAVAMTEWSKPAQLQNGQLHDQAIRGRLLIVQGAEPAYGGSEATNRAMTFVELQNVTGTYDGTGIDIYFDVARLNCELSDNAGRLVPKQSAGAWDGRGPFGPSWVKLPYNSTIRLFVNGGSMKPLMVYPSGEPWCYWSIPANDTNVYYLAGTLNLTTHTNTSFSGPSELTERYWKDHCTATLVFPKARINTFRMKNVE